MAIEEMRIYIENFKMVLSAQTDKCKQDFSEHIGTCKHELEEQCRKTTETNYEQSCKVFSL
ncbi:hypothetical protein DPMN_017294 [Dreissena polymorpha]|uniref:Uncharacterized protein n=1 Tax=Dreissena polymorpha TaxID=45954 RepID=A0A9D4NCX2_DREPO|nr:hypothetical protein DPMN_017294 [Dreissena polymorpha]